MTDIEIKLDEKTDWARVQFQVAKLYGGLRPIPWWTDLLGLGEDLSEAKITFTGTMGFSVSMSIDLWMSEDSVLYWLNAYVRNAWNLHLRRIRTVDDVAIKKQHDLRELALDEIAERHLQGRPPYHVTKAMPAILAAVRKDLLERSEKMPERSGKQIRVWLGEEDYEEIEGLA